MQANTSITQCPYCSLQECHVDFYADSNQEFILCYACGYFQFLLHENKDGKIIKKVMQAISLPFGALKFCLKNKSTPTVFSLESEIDSIRFKHALKKHGFEKFESITLSRVVKGERTITDVLQKG